MVLAIMCTWTRCSWTVSLQVFRKMPMQRSPRIRWHGRYGTAYATLHITCISTSVTVPTSCQNYPNSNGSSHSPVWILGNNHVCNAVHEGFFMPFRTWSTWSCACWSSGPLPETKLQKVKVPRARPGQQDEPRWHKMKQVCNANLSTYESQSGEDLIACNADRRWKLMEIYQTCRGSDCFDIAVLKPQVEQAQEGLKALVGQAGLPRRRNSLK